MTLLNLVKLPITTIDLSPGSHLLINDVTWEQYETLLTDLGGDRRVPRINYCNGTLEIMSPLPAHERPHRSPEEWSQPLPTVNPGEVMRILTKRISLSS